MKNLHSVQIRQVKVAKFYLKLFQMSSNVSVEPAPGNFWMET